MNLSFSKFLTGLFVMTCVLAGSARAELYVDPVLRPLWNQAGEDPRPIVVIVMFKDVAPAQGMPASQSARPWVEAAMRKNAMVSQKATLDKLSSFVSSGTQIGGVQLWLFNGLVLQLPVDKMKTLGSDPNITAIYANHEVKFAQPFAAPIIHEGKFTYGLQHMKIPELRAQAPQMIGTSARIGILDTGIDATHPDLKDKVIGWKDFISSKPAPYDDHSHGTHVGGTIAGGEASGTSIGVAPGAKLIIGKILNGNGGGSWAGVLQGMQWIADPDGDPKTADQPNAVSNSWGGAADFSQDPKELPLCKAVTGWAKLGILPVFAAGNSGPGGQTISIPGACPDALTIGATDDKDAIASFSSRGPAPWKTGSIVKPSVSAPGVAVMSSAPGGGYKTMSGTSMATPHVAGLAALIYQAKPDISYEKIVALIMTSTKHLGEPGQNNTFGTGLVDAVATLKNISQVGSFEFTLLPAPLMTQPVY